MTVCNVKIVTHRELSHDTAVPPAVQSIFFPGALINSRDLFSVKML